MEIAIQGIFMMVGYPSYLWRFFFGLKDLVIKFYSWPLNTDEKLVRCLSLTIIRESFSWLEFLMVKLFLDSSQLLENTYTLDYKTLKVDLVMGKIVF